MFAVCGNIKKIMEKKFIITEGKRIEYEKRGEGKALMLLHGFGADSHIWNALAKSLSRSYLVITPNLPGVNGSDFMSSVSMEELANLAKQIMDEEALPQSVLIGHSMGGYAALAFAEKYPERLNGLGLFHSTAMADDEEKKANRKKGIEFVRTHGASLFLQTTAPKLFGNSTKNKHPEVFEAFMNQLPNMSNEAVIGYYKAMMERSNRTSVLKTSQIPVLFIYGQQDEIIPWNTAIEQASLPPIASVHLLKQAGHLGMIETPAEALKAIEDFLSDI